MDVDRLMTRLSPAVVRVLRSPLHPLLSWGLVLVTVTGRRTGRVYTIPVGYRRDGTTIVVLVSRARRKQWWRNYIEPRPIELCLRGRTVHGTASVVSPASRAFHDAIDGTLRRLPRLGSQFGIRYDPQRGLTDAQARAVAEDAAVVRIDLEPGAQAGEPRHGG
jgi:hypothetical protein